MTHISPAITTAQPAPQSAPGPEAPRRRTSVALGALLAAGAVAGVLVLTGPRSQSAPPAPPPPHVTVSQPLQQTIAVTNTFLGQFSATEKVELRAQVGGTLTAIAFTDGQVVHKGDLLFTIDPRPYEVRQQQAIAQLQTALSRRALTTAELWRAQRLKRDDYGTAESVDQRAADEQGAEAAISSARAALTDAQLDLEYARITAPFTGRIGAHQVSVGNLISGSRAGAAPTTLLATLVSLDPIYLDFDMSEADFIAFSAAHPGLTKVPVQISLDGDGKFTHPGTLDFIDNAVNRDSGTIHMRATVPNPGLTLTPGEFARLRLAITPAAPALLVPAGAVMPDQSQTIVMVVGADGRAAPRIVEPGALYHGLRVIKSGLTKQDRVIIDGLMLARPGSPVIAAPGAIQPDKGDGA